MLDKKFIDLIEMIGYVSPNGKHIYGTAALIHYAHCPMSSLNHAHINRGKAHIEKLLNA